jgi:YbbR domain-containing protein
MLLAPFRWFARNFGALLLALALAFVVWVSAVVTADPNEEQILQNVGIKIIGQDPGLLLVGESQNQIDLTLRAPKSIWSQINNTPELVSAWVDLSGLGAGEHVVDVEVQVDISPTRIILVDPQEVRVTLEPLVSREFPIKLVINGELPLGYRQGTPELQPVKGVVSGAESVVRRVAGLTVTLNIGGAIDTIARNVDLVAVDENGSVVSNLTITPKAVMVTQPISLLGGFKNVVVKVVTTGQVADGYRLTNISVSPPTVTLFSDNPLLIEDIPGFMETLPVDLTGLSDDFETNVSLNLPQGVRVVSDLNVLVQVSVAAIEGSITLTVPVEVEGLSPELVAQISPMTVDIIVAGPLNILENLAPEDFRVVVDLSGQPAGTYQRPPQVVQLPAQVRVQTTLPETIEVVIEVAPTPEPNLTVTGTPQVVATPTP